MQAQKARTRALTHVGRLFREQRIDYIATPTVAVVAPPIRHVPCLSSRSAGLGSQFATFHCIELSLAMFAPPHAYTVTFYGLSLQLQAGMLPAYRLSRQTGKHYFQAYYCLRVMIERAGAGRAWQRQGNWTCARQATSCASLSRSTSAACPPSLYLLATLHKARAPLSSQPYSLPAYTLQSERMMGTLWCAQDYQPHDRNFAASACPCTSIQVYQCHKTLQL